ncbi:DUF4012 domain-containing protein [Patescibacteria group bacterium]|nr:DUF4012 domain-containing protein [Patescibacteria group bacterium]
MNRKGVYSQGDFGVDKTDKKLADFLLSKKTEFRNFVSGHVVDLSHKQPGVLLSIEEKRVKQKHRRKKKVVEKNRGEQTIKPAELFKRFSQNWPKEFEALEGSCPERAQVLAMLEEIEALNNSLKNQTWSSEDGKNFETLEAVLDLPEIIDVEKYLWTEVPAASESDILAELLAEPDFTAIIEPNIEIADNPPAPPFAKGGREEILPSFKRGDGGLNLSDGKVEQSDFLARWWQKKNRSEEISLIPASRKFWGRKSEDITRRGPIRSFARQTVGFLSAGFLIYLVIFGLSLAGQGISAKENILNSALQAYKSMLAAKDSAANLNFEAAGVNFEAAYQNFLLADQELNKMGRGIIYILEKLPGGSQVSSGAALVAAGENLAKAGQSFAQIGDLFLAQKIGDYFSADGQSLTQKIGQVQGEITKAQIALMAADKSLAQVNPDDLPEGLAPQIQELKNKITPAVAAIGQIKNWSNVFLRVLGHERAKKYLLVFQNNSEARASGGFIGTYGVVDLDDGRLKNLFIDNIFNLDGQLYEKIIPPRPIQKVSTSWSTHDANWFADWPTSAKKIMGFYEAAGGATVDGVISLTPTVVERLLALTGPIDLPQYGASLNQNNFLDVMQYKVEVDYDRAQNRPKKILADFAPLFLDRLWQVWPDRGQEIVKILADALAEKHILFYFSNSELEKAFANQGWTGEVLATEKDYLSVVNTNINGFKTDKVVDQKIYHSASVQDDGSVVDTVKIIRRHNGGGSQYDWYNKVNADYLRVYVPLGAKLISAQGQTLEAYSAPIDYQAQGFKADADVAAQEQRMIIDQGSGTQIFQESGKTVFGNWVFVSPGESVEIIYQYLLPFKIDLNQNSASYSLLAQKQSGSVGSDFESILQLPEQAKITWQYPANLEVSGSQIKFSDNLRTDKFYGMVLTR